MKILLHGTCLVVLVLLPGRLAWSQTEIAGDWDQPTPTPGIATGYHEETQDRGGGPDLGDYAGLPINSAARYKASTYSPSWLSVPEHQCLPHPAPYQYRSPGNLSIAKTYDPVTERLTAYEIHGSYGLARTIWMDNRPRPPENAPYTFDGFSLGKWDGDKLVVETTHLKYGFIRRNGVAHSDRARLLEYFVRHDNVLTIITAVFDPVYLEEPFVRSSDYRLNSNASTQLNEFGGFVNGGTGGVYYKCSPVDEVAVDRWLVPHYLPGTNTELDMFSKRHNVPMEAALGGAQTMYPEYMDRVRQLLASRGGAAAIGGSSSGSRPSLTATALTPAVDTQQVTSLHVGGQVWMVTAGGRNVAVQIGSEGVLVVDPGREDLAENVLAEIRKLAGTKRVRFIVNTSADPALFGGNLRVSAGPTENAQRAAIIAHESTSLGVARTGVSGSAIPTDVFFRGERELYFNDEPIEIIHVPSAYSDGDVMVFFRKSDVIVAGHLIEDLTFPVIGAGGSIDGIIDGLNRILLTAVASWRSQGGTQVIPLRGRPYDEGDVAEYRDMVSILRDRVKDAITKGKTVAQMKAEGISQDYDGRYGMMPGPGSTDAFLESAYQSLNAKPRTN